MKKKFLTCILFLLMLFDLSFALDIDYFSEDLSNIQNAKKPEYIKKEIKDDIKIKSISKIKDNKDIKYQDDLLKYIDKSKLAMPRTNVDYNYHNFKTSKLKLRPKKYITTRNRFLHEGDEIFFTVTDDFNYKNNVIKKGDIIKARIETISQNQNFGVPSHLKVGNLSYKDIPINGEIELRGSNRSFWVYPSYYTLLPFFGIGIFFAPIRGGHAKLKPSKEYIFNVN